VHYQRYLGVLVVWFRRCFVWILAWYAVNDTRNKEGWGCYGWMQTCNRNMVELMKNIPQVIPNLRNGSLNRNGQSFSNVFNRMLNNLQCELTKVHEEVDVLFWIGRTSSEGFRIYKLQNRNNCKQKVCSLLKILSLLWLKILPKWWLWFTRRSNSICNKNRKTLTVLPASPINSPPVAYRLIYRNVRR